MKWILLFNLVVSYNIARTDSTGTTSLADLSWLAGYWFAQDSLHTTEEIWLAPHDSIMLGMNRTTINNNRASFEYLRIEQENEGIIYYASPSGKKPVAFHLTYLSPTKVVFENPNHDFPQQISYELIGDQNVLVTIAGTTGSKKMYWQKTDFNP